MLKLKIIGVKNNPIIIKTSHRKILIKKARSDVVELVLGENELDNRILITQYHSLFTWHWWLYLLLPITFLQGFLLKYEREYIDDYFCTFFVKIKKITDLAEISISLNKIVNHKKADKNFYFTFRKDGIQNQEYYSTYYFKVYSQKGCVFTEYKYNKDHFAFRWRTVRIFPVLFTYISIISVFLYETVNHNTLEFIASFVIISFFCIYIMFSDIKKVLAFKLKND